MKRSRTLAQAVDAGDLRSLQALLTQGADPNVPDKRGMLPIHIAALNGRRDVVEALVSAGADIHARDKFGRTPLHHAAFGGHKSVVVYLLLNGADARARGESGLSPLSVANQDAKETALLLQLASIVDLEAVRRLAQSLANTPSRKAGRTDPLVKALLEEMGVDTRIEPLVSAFLEEMRSAKRKEADRPTSPNPETASPEQPRPVSQAASSRRTDRFCNVPVESARQGRSWVVRGADPSVVAGELYAFKESASVSTIINRAITELDRIELEGAASALDVFNEYFRRIGQTKKIPDFRRTLEAALMLYTDNRFFQVLNDRWRNNRSSELLGFSTVMIQAFEHAAYFIEGEVYRGVDLTDVAHYKPGHVFRWPFFVSASTKTDIATEFGRTLFVIEVPASGNVRDIADCSLYPEEGEVLFHPYEVFEVLEAGPKEVRVKISSDIYLGVQGVQETDLGGGAKSYTYSPLKREGDDGPES